MSSGGTLAVTLEGSPPVPCTWSLYNNGVGIAVEYRQLIGRNEGPPQVIASGALGCEGTDTVSHLEIGAELPGPGRLRATLGAAAGSGPLSYACYGQSGSFDVSMVAPAGSSPATPERALAPGDRISTGDSGTAVLLVPGFASVRIRGASSVTSGLRTSGEASVSAGTCGAGEPGLTLEQGGLRSRTLPGGAPLPVAVGGRTVTPRAPILVEATEDGGGRVTVLEGAAVITATDGSAIEIAAGQRYDWPDGGITAAEPDPADILAADETFEVLPLDDHTPVPYGPHALDDGWTWLDPGDDVALELDAPRRVELVVPAGNELWGADISGPRLLRKVSGDFDLEADLAMSTAAQSFAITEFVLEFAGLGHRRPQRPDGRRGTGTGPHPGRRWHHPHQRPDHARGAGLP